MKTPEYIDYESEDLDPLPSFLQQGKKADPYQVPERYFDELPDRILSEIRLDALRPMEQAVPELYFESLAADVENGIVLDKLSVNREAPYTVPADYFEWLPARIQDKLTSAPKSLPVLGRIRNLFRIPYLITGAAACIVIILAIRILSPATDQATSLALNDQERKEVMENPEAFGLEESVVMEHVAVKTKLNDKTTPVSDQNEAIDYLMDNNIDINTLPVEN
ncbi:MAG: hypothetical protein ACHQRM_03355 [Bacteroidia bacterium]